MRYVEINARNYWWRKTDDNKLNELKEYATNDFVRNWIDTTYKKYIINELPCREIKHNSVIYKYKKTPEWVKKSIDNNTPVYFDATHQDSIRHWIDYLNTLPPRPIKMSVKQVIENVKKWDEQKVKATSIGKVKVVMKIGNLTWYQLLDPEALKYESKYMHHCVGKDGMQYAKAVMAGDTQIYSLRDEDNIPHVTVEVTDFELIQVKGNSNRPFKEIYRKPVLQFLNSLHNVVLEGDYPLKDLIENGMYVQDGIVKFISEYKPSNKPISAALFKLLLENNFQIDEVTIQDGEEVELDEFEGDLKIKCKDFGIFSGKGNLTVNCGRLYLENFTGSLSGRVLFLELRNCNITNFKVNDIHSVKIHSTKIDKKISCKYFYGYNVNIPNVLTVTNSMFCDQSNIKEIRAYNPETTISISFSNINKIVCSNIKTCLIKISNVKLLTGQITDYLRIMNYMSTKYSVTIKDFKTHIMILEDDKRKTVIGDNVSTDILRSTVSKDKTLFKNWKQMEITKW